MQADFEIARWDHFELDTRRRLLMAAGKPVKLDAIAFDLLTFLIAHRDSAVARDDILAAIWPGRIVEPGNVTVQLSAIRSALTKAGAAQPLILTLPGRRYRFVGDVTTGASANPPLPPPQSPEPAKALPHADAIQIAAPRAARRRPSTATAGSITALALLLLVGTILYRNHVQPSGISGLSIVVVPFRYRGADQSLSYRADEITDDLIMDLAHIPASTVIARESAEAVKDDSPQEIGRKLNVAYEVTGTVTLEDKTFHVIAKLIDTANGAQIWSLPFDEPKDRLSVARQAIVTAIANNLHFQLDQVTSARSLHDRPDNPGALDLFFQARAVLDADDSLPGLTRAEGLLSSAVEQEPDFSDALAELARTLLRRSFASFDPDEYGDRKKAGQFITRALHLAPRNSTALTAHAWELFLEGKYHEAEYVATDALRIEPSNVDAESVLRDCGWYLGRVDLASSHLEAVWRLDPGNQAIRRLYLMKALIAMFNQRPADAIEVLTRGMSIDSDEEPDRETMGRPEQARFEMIGALVENGELSKAKALYGAFEHKWHNRSIFRYAASFPKALAAAPGMVAFLTALRDANVPQYADGSVERASNSTSCDSDDDYSPTPMRLGDQDAIDVPRLVALLGSSPPPLVIDVGLGAAAIHDSKWYDNRALAESRSDFVDRVVLERSHLGPLPAIVVMGDGPFGCTSFGIAEHLIARGRHNVLWFRGGEEAWVSAGQTSIDYRY